MSSNPSERGIRGITRRHLIRTGISAATIGLSPLLSSCLVNSEDKARIDRWNAATTASSANTARTDTQRNPQPTRRPEPTRATAPTERPRTLEDQVKEIGFNTWFKLFSTPQEISLGKTSLDIEITNINVWQGYLPQLLSTNQQPNNVPLEIKWVARSESYHPWEKNTMTGAKFTGEMQINNVKLAMSFNTALSEVDKANGFQGKGALQIAYLMRSRAITTRLNNWSKNPNAVMAWLNAPEETPLPDYSPWQKEDAYVELTLKNNQLTPNLQGLYKDNGGMLSGLTLPSAALSSTIFGPSNYKNLQIDPPR